MRCRILYEDESVLIAYKPAGLATQSAGVGQADAVSELKNYWAKASKSAGKTAAGDAARQPYLGVVHRLDQPVEGLLAFAKTQGAAAALTKELQRGTLNKTYQALVAGRSGASEGDLKDMLWKDGSTVRVVTGREGEYPDAKEARLHYRVLASDAEKSLLEVRIETGRFHQIRAQLAHAGMPILGDRKYGSAASEGLAVGLRGLALCARTLELIHPVTKKKMHWELKEKTIDWKDS